MAVMETAMSTNFDLFKAYFGQFFSNVDAEAPWLRDLFNSSQKFYGMGATDVDIPDLLLNDANVPQSYKDRFAGIFALKAKNATSPGSVSHIPTVAEYAALSSNIKQELNKYSLNGLATDKNIADIIGNDVSLSEVQDRLSIAFNAIDNADQFLKKELASSFPMLGRVDLAHALLAGPEGSVALKKKIDIAGVRAAASEFGLSNQMSAEELSNMGVDRAGARAGYQKTKQELGGLTQAAGMFGQQGANLQAELEQQNVLGKSSNTVNTLKSQVRAEFGGSGGTSQGSLRKKATNL